METAQLARVVVLIWSMLKNSGALRAGDPGAVAILDEIEAYIQVLRERTRSQEEKPYHTTPRGKAALARAKEEL